MLYVDNKEKLTGLHVGRGLDIASLVQLSPNFLDTGPYSRSYQRPRAGLFCVSKTKNTTRITLVTLVFFYSLCSLTCLQCDL